MNARLVTRRQLSPREIRYRKSKLFAILSTVLSGSADIPRCAAIIRSERIYFSSPRSTTDDVHPWDLEARRQLTLWRLLKNVPWKTVGPASFPGEIFSPAQFTSRRRAWFPVQSVAEVLFTCIRGTSPSRENIATERAVLRIWAAYLNEEKLWIEVWEGFLGDREMLVTP